MSSNSKKHQRNDPCPCGSGKKYKKCCGLLEQSKTDNPGGRADGQVKLAEAIDPNSLQIAMQKFEAGHLADAATICTKVLRIEPGNTYALNLSAVIACQSGDAKLAIKQMKKALTITPDAPALHNNLGKIYSEFGEFDAAAISYRKAIVFQPDFSQAHANLANVLRQQNKLDDAVESYNKAISLKPDNAEFYSGLGDALQEQGNLEDAMASYEKALAINPLNVDACNGLGTALGTKGLHEPAVARFKQAVAIKPDHMASHNNLGNALKMQGDCIGAMEHYMKAISLAPDNAVAHYNLGYVLQAQGKLEEAILQYTQALRIKPDDVETLNNIGIVYYQKAMFNDAKKHYELALAYNPDYAKTYSNLGNVYISLGLPELAIPQFKKALELDPEYVEAHSNLLFCMNYISAYDPKALFELHLQFAKKYQDALLQPTGTSHDNLIAQKRLRIGYVSGDFLAHSVAYFIEPVLSNHDRAHFEVFCYSNNVYEDQVTMRLRSHADRWINISTMSDEVAAQTIINDQIDILVDLSGHTGKHRLLVFARKPAPLQFTWLGYLNTTGLSAMDYRLTDFYACPENMMERYHSETLARLPDSQWCYRPPDDSPAVTSTPALGSGEITFGSFHNLAKVTPGVIDLWSKVLSSLPRSRLFIVGRGLDQMSEKMLERFAVNGIGPERLELLSDVPFYEYLALHGRVDINLDTFPYTGGTTTCHSVWMGVPVITLVGNNVTSRGGASILSVLELTEMIAKSEQEYIDIAVRLSGDLQVLNTLRQELRSRMRSSAMIDEKRFTRNLELVYRKAWEKMCTQLPH